MNNKIAVMQPYLFPYIGYFQLINAADKFVLLDDVNYINKGWISRNNILVNNKPYLFTIPLKRSSQNKLIRDTEISYETDWQGKLLQTVKRSYSKAPYFKDVFSLISEPVLKNEKFISKLNYLCMINVCEYLGINSRIIESSQIYNNKDLKGEERIKDICIKENSQHYINLSGGMDLYSKESFEKNNISLDFIKTKNIDYKQFKNEFFGSLSIIDVLMFNSKEKVCEYLMEYEIL